MSRSFQLLHVLDFKFISLRAIRRRSFSSQHRLRRMSVFVLHRTWKVRGVEILRRGADKRADIETKTNRGNTPREIKTSEKFYQFETTVTVFAVTQLHQI